MADRVEANRPVAGVAKRVRMGLIRTSRQLRHHQWHGEVAAGAILIAALLARGSVGAAFNTVPFITVFPAIVLATLFGGSRAGAVVATLGGVASWYYQLPPGDSFAPDRAGILILAVYAATAALLVYVIHRLNQAIDDLADERERTTVLFQELQHRVANNMAFLAAVLNLQRRTIETAPEKATHALEETVNRLNTMARIHRRLYDPALVELPVSQFFKDLCTDILNASGAKNIVCIVEVPPITLDLKRLVTLALLVSEIVTNSVKHAFGQDQQGTISIKMECKDRQCVLRVSDDGRGMPAGEKGEGLGSRIMQSLATQLGGNITTTSEGGTQARVEFPLLSA
jgi:two-component sensor histidine kinase